MTAHRALIDTGAIYAFVTRTDQHHEEARAFMGKFLDNQGVFLLADLVFAETMTLMKARLGAAVAIRVGRELRRSPVYVWTPLGPEGEQAAWAAFQRYHDQDWSYTDCALLAMAQHTRIPDVFSFDRHFDHMPGVIRLP